MRFSEKLRNARIAKGLTQAELGRLTGVSARTIINYETEGRYPRRREMYAQLAQALGVTESYLLAEGDDAFLAETAVRYGSSAAQDARALLSEAAAVFAGGELSDEDRLAFMTEIQQLYLESKALASQKFGAKRPRG